MRISMLGQSGSGKTTFMCALHKKMIQNDFGGFSILPYTENLDNKDSLAAIGMLENISFCRDGQNVQFPQGTDATTYWTFNLLYQNRNLCRLDWIDYRGGKINEIFDGDNEAKLLKDLIYGSNAIIVFIDAIDLALIDNIDVCKRKTGADKLSFLLKDYERIYRCEDTIILFVLSKCDSPLIVQKYKENNYYSLVDKCRRLFKDILLIKERNSHWHIGIIPISSIGDEKTNTSKELTEDILQPYKVSCNLCKYPSPINVAEGFLFCINEIIKISKQRTQNEVSKMRDQIIQEFTSATLTDSICSAIKRQDSHYELASKLNASKILSETKITQLGKITDIINQTVSLEKVYIL